MGVARIDGGRSEVLNRPMKLHLMPKTTLGKWSVALIVAFIILLVSLQLLVASGQRGSETFFSALILTVPILIAGIKRSVIVYLAVTIGLLVLLWGLVSGLLRSDGLED